ncbi:hypothetical protein GCM10027073_61600 [Streptomyces chlorus]
MLETTLPGVFAAGDVRSGSVKRVASAVGEGAVAVRLVQEHLAQEGNLVRPPDADSTRRRPTPMSAAATHVTTGAETGS